MTRLLPKTLVIVFVILLISGCVFYCNNCLLPQSSTPEIQETLDKPIRLVLQKDSDGKDTLLEFYRGKRRILSYIPTYRIGFMKCMEGFYGNGNSRRMSFEFIDAKTDYRDFLIDMKGDDDPRHLIIADWFGGNSAYCYKGYLIDTKDDCAVIGEVPVGECIDYKYKNPDLVFAFSEEIAYFGVAGYASVRIPLKIEKGKFPVCMIAPAKEFGLGSYQEILKRESEEGEDYARQMAFYCLYCDLASAGLMRHAEKYADELGFTPQEIDKYRHECLEIIRKSLLYKYLLQVNGGDEKI